MRRHVLLLTVALLLGVVLSTRPALAERQGETGWGTPTALPDTPVGRQLSWVLGILNGDPITVDDVTARFAPSFLSTLPATQAVASTQQFARTYCPFTFEGLIRAATDTQAIALIVGNDGSRITVVVSVEAAAPHRITALILQPAPPALATSGDRLDGLFDVGGRRLYLSCMGASDDGPTVVLEAGHGNDSTIWLAVQAALAPTTRVCAYDRANAPGGTSDPAPTPRTAEDVVSDLRALLDAADVPGPYVLVGHSLGGLFVRLYASEHPDEIAGLVLVDPSHEDQADRTRQLVGPDLWSALEAQAASFTDPEGFDVQVIAEQVRSARAAAPLPTVPLVILTHGLPADSAQLPPTWPTAEEEAMWRELHQDLAGLVPEGRQIIAEQSGHFIQLDQPELVVASVLEVVAAAHSPRTQGTPGAAER